MSVLTYDSLWCYKWWWIHTEGRTHCQTKERSAQKEQCSQLRGSRSLRDGVTCGGGGFTYVGGVEFTYVGGTGGGGGLRTWVAQRAAGSKDESWGRRIDRRWAEPTESGTYWVTG
jgi:hypothetical protein